MKYFLDTEFIEDGKTIDLISIGMVCEDGRELYLQNLECEFEKASDWVVENVFPGLTDFKLDIVEFQTLAFRKRIFKPIVPTQLDYHSVWQFRNSIAERIKNWIAHDTDPEFWGYYADYDWVVFCQLFGKMINLPRSFPKYCKDIKQLCVDLGNPKLPEQTSGEHNALEDARWNKAAYNFLKNLK